MYKEENIWRSVQEMLPEGNRITEEIFPREYFIESGGFNIHLDHYQPTVNAKTCVILFHGVGGNRTTAFFSGCPARQAGYEVICPDLPGYGFRTFKKRLSYACGFPSNRYKESCLKVFQ